MDGDAMETNQEEFSSAIDTIVQNFSKLFTHLDPERGNCDGNGPDITAQKLRKLYEDIYGIQDKVEKFGLFKEGQNLYTKWILLVEQCETVDAVNLNLGDLVALSYNNRGYLKYLQVDFKGALEDYTRALRCDPNLACAYYNRGLVTYRLAFFDQAVADMKAAVNLSPDQAEYREGLTKCSEMLGSPNGHDFKLEYGDANDQL